MGRSEQREHIFKLIFGTAFSEEGQVEEQMELYLDQLGEIKDSDRSYILNKARDIASKIKEIDAMIDEHASGWKPSRMNKVDLSILRLAVYEMKWDEDVPVKVAINEAVELAKKFSGDDGPSFVNGILGKMV